MSTGHHLWNMYITAAVSVALVLCLVGLESVLLLSVGALMKRVKAAFDEKNILNAGISYNV